jgi:hypothetical protein
MNNFKFDPTKLGTGIQKLAIASFLGLYFLKHAIYKVEPGSLAIKFNIFKGVVDKTYKEGYHLLIPFVERPIIYDCRMKNHVFMCVCGTKGKFLINKKTCKLLP